MTAQALHGGPHVWAASGGGGARKGLGLGAAEGDGEEEASGVRWLSPVWSSQEETCRWQWSRKSGFLAALEPGGNDLACEQILRKFWNVAFPAFRLVGRMTGRQPGPRVSGAPAGWYPELIAIMHDEEEAVVVLGGPG